MSSVQRSLADHRQLGGLASQPATTSKAMQQSLFSLEPEPIKECLSDDIAWGCDYGSGYFHCFNGRYLRLRPEQFASLSFADDFDTVVIENAHMQPKRRSLAQVFTYEQLAEIADTAALRNIEIRLWFHSQTPKWRSLLNMGDKSDETDAKTIYGIVRKRGLEGLQYFRPRSEYPSRIKWAHRQVEDMNDILNAARIDYESNKCPAVHLFNTNGRRGSMFTAWKMYGAHSQECRDISRWFLGDDSFRQGLSLWAALVDWNGAPRVFNGQQPGVKFVMNELLRQKPNHFRGGVARSNIMYWGFRNDVISHLGTRIGGKIDKRLHQLEPHEHAKWLAHRRKYRAAMVKTLHAMKAYVNQ
jgi:hypothetical protein